MSKNTRRNKHTRLKRPEKLIRVFTPQEYISQVEYPSDGREPGELKKSHQPVSKKHRNARVNPGFNQSVLAVVENNLAREDYFTRVTCRCGAKVRIDEMDKHKETCPAESHVRNDKRPKGVDVGRCSGCGAWIQLSRFDKHIPVCPRDHRYGEVKRPPLADIPRLTLKIGEKKNA